MSGNKTLYTTMKCRSMTTKEEFEKIRESVLTALNNENVKNSKIIIFVGGSDIEFYRQDVVIKELYDLRGISIEHDNEIDFTLLYEDIDVIGDISNHKIIYVKEK